MTGAEGPSSGLRDAVASLDPGYFALVMASGIVAIASAQTGYRGLSDVLLGFTLAALVVLGVVYLLRVVIFWDTVVRSWRDPTTAMAFFTVVAGLDVVAVRVSMAGHPQITLGLAAAAALLWLVLTYGLPASLVASARRPVLGEINGTWLIWVVATQSLSVVATVLAPTAPASALRAELPVVAVCLWGVGVMLYLILIVIIFMRLLLVEVTPAEMGPAYWIAMGATAIGVRAAAGIVDLHERAAVHLQGELRPFVIGLSVVLWAFGTWWIPLLVAFGVWRYLVRRYPWSYEPRLWSVVFPLGMYAVASMTLGRAGGFGFMVSIARVWVFVAVVAWALVMAAALRSLATALWSRRRRRGTPRAIGS
ncbi:MAG: tellurite resistance/C4-dicarboxylate transporter family protein [Acidimicrobiales bacterium]